jgi:uncharacterized Zn finger protein
MTRKNPKRDLLKQLTWDDLEEWAGSRVLGRGQGYQRSRRVEGLAQTQKGEIVAWVQGGKRYATVVGFEDAELVSTCTCPYGATCKHAVAVVLEYLDQLKKNIEVPIIDEQDRRLLLLKDFPDDEARENGEEDEEYEESVEADVPVSKRSGKSALPGLKSFLEQQTKEQLVTLMEELSGKYSSVREDLQDRQNLSTGSVKKIVAAVRKEIHELSSEPGWRNHWNNGGYIPDYSRVKGRLESLLAKGHADEVVSLGKELFEAGIRQVEMSHDEGETGTEISSCLEIVFQTLPLSSLSPVEQMLWVIDAELEDEYELCYHSESFWKKKQQASDWSAVADKLVERLKNLQPAEGEDSFSRSYRRDQLSNWIIRAFENAGRQEQIIPLCEQEAVKTGSYTRLVDALRKAKRLGEAEQWIHRGIKATQKELPGIASNLRDVLRDMREKEGNWKQVAAFRADDFLGSPSLHSYEDMKKAAERAKVWPTVRQGALCYLETGKLPQADSSWPLPETNVAKDTDYRREKAPMIHTLIDIAIAEKRTDDVLHWYDHPRSQKGGSWGWDGFREDDIAEALATRYPDRALAIWKKLAEKQIALTKPQAYEAAAIYLRKVHGLLKKLKRESEWEDYLLKLRQANVRKTKFIEILSRLEGRRIIEGKL